MFRYYKEMTIVYCKLSKVIIVSLNLVGGLKVEGS